MVHDRADSVLLRQRSKAASSMEGSRHRLHRGYRPCSTSEPTRKNTLSGAKRLTRTRLRWGTGRGATAVHLRAMFHLDQLSKAGDGSLRLDIIKKEGIAGHQSGPSEYWAGLPPASASHLTRSLHWLAARTASGRATMHNDLSASNGSDQAGLVHQRSSGCPNARLMDRRPGTIEPITQDSGRASVY